MSGELKVYRLVQRRHGRITAEFQFTGMIVYCSAMSTAQDIKQNLEVWNENEERWEPKGFGDRFRD